MKIEKKVFLEKLNEIFETQLPLTMESNFSEIDNIDSLTYMVISAWLSDILDTKISPAEIEKLISFQDLYDLIK